MHPLLPCLLALTLFFPQNSAALPPDTKTDPIRIMPLGDSITEGDDGYASYRYWLWHKLKRSGYRVDFVGSQKGVWRGEPRFSDFDQDHEGHWAWTTTQVAERIDSWAKMNPADIVLIHLGSNDVHRNNGITEAIEALDNIISILRKHNPAVSILLAKIIPHEGGTQRVELFNKQVSSLASRLNSPTSKVLAVDQYKDFDVSTDTYDGLHPNESGEKKIATRWMLALHTVVPAAIDTNK